MLRRSSEAAAGTLSTGARARAWLLVALLGAAGAPLVAHANGPALTEFLVTLRNGGIYRGEVLEYEPGDHVTLKLARGDIKTFPWRDVASAGPLQGGRASSQTQAAAANSVPPSKPVPPIAARAASPAPTPAPRPAPAPAPPSAPTESEYDRHVRTAEFLYQKNESARALREFQAAYQLSPRPKLLYQMAKCYQQLRRYDDAVLLYRRYMREDPALAEEQRARLGALVASLSEMSVPPSSEVGAPPRSETEESAPVDTGRVPYRRRTGLMVTGIVMLAGSYSATAIFASLGLAGASSLSTQDYSQRAINEVKTALQVLYIPVAGPLVSSLLVREPAWSVPWIFLGLGTQVAGLAMTLAGAQKRPVDAQADGVAVVPHLGPTGGGLALVGTF